MKRLMARTLLLLMVSMLFVTTAFAFPEDARNCVVRVYTQSIKITIDENGVATSQTSGGTGTGFVVGATNKPGQYIVTNKHCVVEEGYQINNVYIILTDSSEKIPVNVVAVSERTDLAILFTPNPIAGREPAVLVKNVEESLKLVDPLFALGFPGAADDLFSADSNVDYPSTLDRITITAGNYSRYLTHGETKQGAVVQHNAEINHGNSGGPLMNEKGQVIGVNTWGSTRGQGVYWSISSDEVIKFLDDQGIPYTLASDAPDLLPIIVAAVVGLLLLVAIIVIVKQLARKPAQDKKSAGGQWLLVGEAGVMQGKSFKLLPVTRMGRSPRECQIVFPERTHNVSSKHCILKIDANGVTVIDENSTCGTTIDGQKIQPGVPMPIREGQRLSLGSNAQTFILRKK